ncbi:gliding motility-associated C-terminal domain-containing protein [Lacihabitans sp. CCS-44]|uniref:T9SS type B sorting domain-containing protein n=1 Tax=Lacihabitans sp. CCS-44 TaxID=2487331 RepID=UPI0020CD9144|nr:T9SS type B sorting domain-containing protein [Lacihabitans sp. CCS-44]MCP9754961.1 gliding motility-associated C-terminal domain-containing protein [Lacihabitans sp. CCS-44]
MFACQFVYGQGLCDKNNWPANAVEGAFKIEGDITAGCSPLTVKLKDLSGGTDIRYDFYYNGKTANALDKVGNKDSVNVLFANTTIEVYRILQYGKKNGKDMYACKTVSVRPNNKPVFSYSTCNDNFLNIIIPQDPANDFDFYTIEWGDSSPIQTISSLPFSTNKTYAGTSPTKIIRIKGENNIPTGCPPPPFQTIVMNSDGNIPKITELEVLPGGNKAKLTFTGTFDSHQIYRRVPSQNYSFPNYTYQSNPGTITVDLINNQQTCFMVYKYVACPQLSGEVCSIKLDSIEPISVNSNRIKWQELQNNQASSILNTATVKNVVYDLDWQMIETNSILNQKIYSINSDFDHPILKCEAQYCYQVVAKVQGEWSVNPTVPYSSISKSEIKCVDRKKITAPPISDGKVSVIDDKQIDLLFQDNSNWPVNKDKYYLYKYLTGANAKIDSIDASQNKKFSLNENTDAESFCYKIGYIDKCGSVSHLSSPMCTIYLQASENDELNWSINSPFGNSAIQNFELISVDENTSAESLEKVLGPLEKSSTVDISNNEIEAKYKIRAHGNGNLSSVSNQISIPIEALFYIPDAFTPNEDNINNLFEIKGRFGRVNDYNLKIYDRWGNIITEIKDKTERWDGKLNGTRLPFGSYLYDLKIGLNRGEIIRKFGKFEIL